MSKRKMLLPILIVSLLALSSCSQTTVGDGVFDALEQAYFQVAVGAA